MSKIDQSSEEVHCNTGARQAAVTASHPDMVPNNNPACKDAARPLLTLGPGP